MPKKNKKERQAPNIVLFLVEGESDKIALEIPLANLIIEKHPDYEVRFLLQERIVNNVGDEVEDASNDDDEDEDGDVTDEVEDASDDDDEDDEDEGGNVATEVMCITGGDITTSSYVKPENIELKITHRFIRPAIRREGIYPKKIAKIIQIVDMDGAYIPDENIVLYTQEHQDYEKPFYDEENGRIETKDVEALVLRNKQKRDNIDYLLALPEQKIKIKTKRIPYEIYFFSSNMDHFVNNDANIKEGKKRLASTFLKSYGLDTEAFCKFFLEDPSSIGHLGYVESWEQVKKGTASVKRSTNIDYLIRKLIENE